jgi:hypothetical protein
MTTHAQLLRDAERIEEITEAASAAVRGRVVRILSDYNGQPYGRSRKSLKGTAHVVSGVYFDVHPARAILSLEDQSLSIDATEVEFV